MTTKTISSSLKIKTSEIPSAVGKRYGLFDDEPDLELSRTSVARRQDQRLKDDITNTLYRLELDNVKPSFDIVAQTGFRRGFYPRKRIPGEDLSLGPATPSLAQVKRTSRRHSYIEPQVILQQQQQPWRMENTMEKWDERLRERPVTIKEVRVREPEPRRQVSSTTWHYTDPRSYSYIQSTIPSYEKAAAEENRALTDYKESLFAPVTSKSQQRWSIYGTTPSLVESRSRSTPPGVYSTTRARVPIGDRLTRRINHEYDIGVKLAESQTELDSFNRLLDKKFGRADDYLYPSRKYYRTSPSWSTTSYTYPVYSEYKVPDYRYTVYSPPTRITRPSETSMLYSYSTYDPYSTRTSTNTRYVPTTYNTYTGYGSYGYEPWYLPYSRRSYFVESPAVSSLGRINTTRYLY